MKFMFMETPLDLFGSSCFQLFADVTPTLHRLKQQGMRLGLISNWQRGLKLFCEELGVAAYFDVIISSAEVKSEKADPRIFQEPWLDSMHRRNAHCMSATLSMRTCLGRVRLA